MTDETKQVLALLDEYAAKLGAALDKRNAHRQRLWAELTGVVTTLIVIAVVASVLINGRGDFASLQTVIPIGLPVALCLLAYSWGEWMRLSNTRDVVSKIAARLDPVIRRAITAHDRIEANDFDREVINLKMTEARLRIEQAK